jgi:hypothetical protein
MPVLPTHANTPRELFDAAVTALRCAAQPPKGISAQLLGEEYSGPLAFRVVLGYYRWHIQIEVSTQLHESGRFHVATVRASYRDASAAASTIGRVLHQWKPLSSIELADELATEQVLVNFLGNLAVKFEHLDEFAAWVLKRRPY